MSSRALIIKARANSLVDFRYAGDLPFEAGNCLQPEGLSWGQKMTELKAKLGNGAIIGQSIGFFLLLFISFALNVFTYQKLRRAQAGYWQVGSIVTINQATKN